MRGTPRPRAAQVDAGRGGVRAHSDREVHAHRTPIDHHPLRLRRTDALHSTQQR